MNEPVALYLDGEFTVSGIDPMVDGGTVATVTLQWPNDAWLYASPMLDHLPIAQLATKPVGGTHGAPVPLRFRVLDAYFVLRATARGAFDLPIECAGVVLARGEYERPTHREWASVRVEAFHIAGPGATPGGRLALVHEDGSRFSPDLG